jgi:hypothetical protein
MMGIHNSWREFLTEGKFTDDKLLREVTFDEMRHIEKALEEMGPEDLAFTGIFKDKNRVLIDFPTRNTGSVLGTFIDFFRKAGYSVDWDKGVLSGVLNIRDSSPSGVAASLIDRNVAMKKTEKKIQMKVGKFLAKLKKDISKYNLIRAKIGNYMKEKYGPGGREGTFRDIGARARREESWNPTGVDVKNALENNEDEIKQYYRLNDQIRGYLGDDWESVHGEDVFKKVVSTPMIDQMSVYWQKNADYIKKNLSALDENKYSIIITRHPVDVLRMSDFDDINSCHSPPSRPQAEGSYYKCAVAEAHGHGAIAYVVNNADLDEEFGTTNLRAIEESSAFQQNQDLFYDEARDAGAEIEPVSRLRLRQVRYWDDTRGFVEEQAGTQLAVPESRIYGVQVPGFRERLMKWAVENQKEALANAPKRDSLGLEAVNLDNFIKFGGSYEDNWIRSLTKELFKKG